MIGEEKSILNLFLTVSFFFLSRRLIQLQFRMLNIVTDDHDQKGNVLFSSH